MYNFLHSFVFLMFPHRFIYIYGHFLFTPFRRKTIWGTCTNGNKSNYNVLCGSANENISRKCKNFISTIFKWNGKMVFHGTWYNWWFSCDFFFTTSRLNLITNKTYYLKLDTNFITKWDTAQISAVYLWYIWKLQPNSCFCVALFVQVYCTCRFRMTTISLLGARRDMKTNNLRAINKRKLRAKKPKFVIDEARMWKEGGICFCHLLILGANRLPTKTSFRTSSRNWTDERRNRRSDSAANWKT